MSFQFVSSLYDLFVKRVFYVVLNGYDDRLIHLIADNLTRTCFSQISLFHGLSPSYRPASVIRVWIRAIFFLTSLILLVLSNWFVAFWNLKLKSSFLAATNS